MATLCSLCLCLWGWQTGAWRLAIPIILLLEGRNLIQQRWKLPEAYLQAIYVLCVSLWMAAMFFIPFSADITTLSGSIHHLLKCLPVGFFPLLLVQTYASNFRLLYQEFNQKFLGRNQSVNFYPPYFGLCLLSASATGGNSLVFLICATLLLAGFLGTLRPQRFGSGIFYSLIFLAALLSLLATLQFHRLQMSFQFNSGEWLSQGIRSLVSVIDNDRPIKPVDLEAFKRANQTPELPKPTIIAIPVPPGTPGSLTVSTAENPPAGRTGSGGSAGGNQPGVGQTGTNTSGGNAGSGTNSNQTVATAPPAGGSAAPNSESAPTSENAPQLNNSSANGAGSEAGTETGTESGNSPEAGAETPSAVPEPPAPGTPAPPQSGSTSPARPGTTPPRGNPQLQTGGQADPAKSTTGIGRQGTIQPANNVLFTVSPTPDSKREIPLPLYIREASFNQYRAGTWNAGQPRFVRKAQAHHQGWTFGSPSSDSISVKILTSLQQAQQVLKLPVGTSDVEQLSVDGLQVNQYGTVLAQGKPGKLAYIAKFDPIQSFDSPPTQLELEIPPAERPALEQILNSLDVQQKSAPETVRAIEAFFQKGFRYTLQLPTPDPKTTPIAKFLLRDRAGHCEYYATATTLLLRAAGIPSRYAVGYSVQEYNPEQKQYLVRASNAHAWVQAYVNNAWVTLDTTPGDGQFASGTAPDSPSPSPTASTTGTNAKPEPSPTAAPTASLTPAKPEAAKPAPAPDNRPWHEKLWATWQDLEPERRDTILWIGMMTVFGGSILLTCGWLAWKSWRRKQRGLRKQAPTRQQSEPGQPLTDGVGSEFYHLEEQLSKWGLERQPAETAKQWTQRLQTQLPETQAAQLQEVIDLHYRYRFDPEGITEEDREQLRSMIQTWLRETRRTRAKQRPQATAKQG